MYNPLAGALYLLDSQSDAVLSSAERNPLRGALYLLDADTHCHWPHDDGTSAVDYLYKKAADRLKTARLLATHAFADEYGWAAPAARDPDLLLMEWIADAGRVSHDVLALAGVDPNTAFGEALRAVTIAGVTWRHAEIAMHGRVSNGTPYSTMPELTSGLLRSARWSSYAASTVLPTFRRVVTALTSTDWVGTGRWTDTYDLDDTASGVEVIARRPAGTRDPRVGGPVEPVAVSTQEFHRVRDDYSGTDILMIVGAVDGPARPAVIIHNGVGLDWRLLCLWMTYGTPTMPVRPSPRTDGGPEHQS